MTKIDQRRGAKPYRARVRLCPHCGKNVNVKTPVTGTEAYGDHGWPVGTPVWVAYPAIRSRSAVDVPAQVTGHTRYRVRVEFVRGTVPPGFPYGATVDPKRLQH